MLQRVRSFPKTTVVRVAVEVLKRNSYFAHPENIILGMLASSKKDVRERGMQKVLSLRDHNQWSNSIRKFIAPEINLEAKCFSYLCDIEDDSVEEPPAIRSMNEDQIKSVINVPLVLKHPCHNQNVERHVKLVTEASSSVCSFERRDGMIRQKIRSRKLMKRFDNKSQFKFEFQ